MILVGGTVAADIITWPVDHYPNRGEIKEVDGVTVALGGCVGNTGLALASLEVPVCAVSRLGDDIWGNVIHEKISRSVQQSAMPVDTNASSPTTIVFLHPDGTRSFMHSAGALARFSAPDLVDAGIEDPEIRAIHLGYALLMPQLDGEPLQSVLTQAKENKKLTSLDVAWQPDAKWPMIKSLLPNVDLFCPNYDEARAISGTSNVVDMGRRLLDMGVREAVVIKQGEQGSTLLVKGECPRHISTLAIDGQVMDTTGAGDAFIAGMLAGWYRGLDWTRAACVASVAGAMATTGTGAGAYLADWHTTVIKSKNIEVKKFR